MTPEPGIFKIAALSGMNGAVCGFMTIIRAGLADPVSGALVTACRYGELIRKTARDFNVETGTADPGWRRRTGSRCGRQLWGGGRPTGVGRKRKRSPTPPYVGLPTASDMERVEFSLNGREGLSDSSATIAIADDRCKTAFAKVALRAVTRRFRGKYTGALGLWGA